jgi:CRP-like cAMP-binding protein
MKDTLEKQFRSFGALSEDDIAWGIDYFFPKSFKKDDLLIKAGETCNWIAFVCSGIVRNYYISSKGEEVTYCLTFPHHFITAYSSFITSEKTFENIQLLTDAEMLVIKRAHFQELVSSSNSWLKFSNHLAEQTYILMEKRLLAIQMESAEKRYHDLLSSHPEFIQRVPLKYLASYLGITQRHLSRIRSKLS